MRKTNLQKVKNCRRCAETKGLAKRSMPLKKKFLAQKADAKKENLAYERICSTRPRFLPTSINQKLKSTSLSQELVILPCQMTNNGFRNKDFALRKLGLFIYKSL